MAKRFGRNQKRRMREEIVAAQNAAAEEKAARAGADYRARMAERSLADAEGRAFRAFLANADRYEYLCNRLVDAAARELGERLRPQLESVMDAARRHDRILHVGAKMDIAEPIRIMTVVVPEIRVNHAERLLGSY